MFSWSVVTQQFDYDNIRVRRIPILSAYNVELQRCLDKQRCLMQKRLESRQQSNELSNAQHASMRWTLTEPNTLIPKDSETRKQHIESIVFHLAATKDGSGENSKRRCHPKFHQRNNTIKTLTYIPPLTPKKSVKHPSASREVPNRINTIQLQLICRFRNVFCQLLLVLARSMDSNTTRI